MKRLTVFVLCVLSISLAAFSQDYYWYNGEKISLIRGDQQYFLYDDLLSESDKSKIEKSDAVSDYEGINLKWGITKHNAVIEDTAHVYYSTIGYQLPNEKNVFVTHRFYVKLKDKNDLPILQEYAEQYNVRIEADGSSKWYVVFCSLRPQQNALELANLFYESGLFEASEPEIIGGIEFVNALQLNQDQAPKASKVLHEGNLYILRGEKTFTITGAEVK